MHTRIQTWFPFNIQVALNGREWLSRQMNEAGVRYRQEGNCFVWIEDYEQAGKLLQQQLETNWPELLSGFARQLNPSHESIFERYPSSYYWTCYQSAWTTAIVFREEAFLKRLMPLLVRHGMLSFSSTDVMRYFGRRVNQSGEIPAYFNGTLQTDLKRHPEGERVQYRLNGNSAKFYDQAYSAVGSVLRGAETTINTVRDFRVYRLAIGTRQAPAYRYDKASELLRPRSEGGPDDDLQWREMRKGIADLHRRAEVSQKTNERLLNALAKVDDTERVEELTAGIQKHSSWQGRRVRARRPWGEDYALCQAILQGEFLINGFRNRDLQRLLYDHQAGSAQEQRSRSAAISRKLCMLRAHGLLQKVPRSHRYHVTARGQSIWIAVLTTARSSVPQLNQLPQAA